MDFSRNDKVAYWSVSAKRRVASAIWGCSTRLPRMSASGRMRTESGATKAMVAAGCPR